MRVERATLANGLRLAVAPVADVRSTAVFLAIEAGQWHEPAGRAGVARPDACHQCRIGFLHRPLPDTRGRESVEAGVD